MFRRDTLTALTGSALLLGGAVLRPASAQAPAPAATTAFDDGTVRGLARALAGRPYEAPNAALPRGFTDIGYDEYRSLRFDPQRALWRDANLRFQAQLFHRGFLYAPKVALHEVANGQARPIPYDPATFTIGDRPPPGADFGHAGFRLHFPLNRPDVSDEVAAFLGASYFRAVAKGLQYGLSARGLAIKTADPGGEEFPAFRSFWLERPRPGADSAVVHALLDSPSAAASFRFTIRPGETTVFDVQATVFPRVEITAAGIAPLTSMYWFAPNDRTGIDDYRRAVHDSDGLMMLTGRGEDLWRPLANPHKLQISSFGDTSPRGFGLVQRHRQLEDYEDLEAHYERRPSLWVEPIGDWGEGAIQLIEIPTDNEVNDNIAAFWRPKQPMRAGEEYNLVYRLHWLPVAPGNPDLATFAATSIGAAGRSGRLFVLDAIGGKPPQLPADAVPTLELSANPGEIRHPVVLRNPVTQGWRAHFELAPGNARLIELRAVLKVGDRPITETWLYRWTA